MMRVLLDTNVILDFVLNRPPWSSYAAAILRAHQKGDIEGYISAITPVNLYYIARKMKGASEARLLVGQILASLKMCSVDQSVLQVAHSLPFADYEDAVQHACATASSMDAIVTRNLKDYKNATLPVYSPSDFLKRLP